MKTGASIPPVFFSCRTPPCLYDCMMSRDNTFVHMLPDGSLVDVDNKTLEVVNHESHMFLRGEDGVVPFHKSLKWMYDKSWGELICQKISEGLSMTKISKLPGFPSISIIGKWRANNEKFEEMIVFAKKLRAEYYADAIADKLEDMEDLSKDKVPAMKLATEARKWLASKGDKETYGDNRVTGDHMPSNVSIMIDTGVRRESSLGENTVTLEKGDYTYTGEEDGKNTRGEHVRESHEASTGTGEDGIIDEAKDLGDGEELSDGEGSEV